VESAAAGSPNEAEKPEKFSEHDDLELVGGGRGVGECEKRARHALPATRETTGKAKMSRKCMAERTGAEREPFAFLSVLQNVRPPGNETGNINPRVII